jgi:ribose-phosphate pyrophosphokinase
MLECALLAGSANPQLAEAISGSLQVPLATLIRERFPDGELHVEVTESLRRRQVFIIQPTGPPVGEHLLELLLLADAARRDGAACITAVIPYLGYARQDRRARGREAVAARVGASLLEAGGVDGVVAVDLHVASLEGFFRIPVEHVSAVRRLAEAIRRDSIVDGVVVSPDLGAAKLAEQYGALLGLPVAIVHKTRLSGEEVRVERVIGDVQGRTPIVIDDMISTGGTIQAAVHALLAAGALPHVIVLATHSLLVGPAVERLRSLPLKRLVSTDSLPIAEGLALPIEVVSVGPLLADAIARLTEGRSLQDLLAHV